MTKLDIISFARLIAYVQSIVSTSDTLANFQIDKIYDLTETSTQIPDILPNEHYVAKHEVYNSLQRIAFFLRDGQKISAIKEYRLITGMGLKESKEAIESFPTRQASSY